MPSKVIDNFFYSPPSRKKIYVVNPLGAALSHYTARLAHSLDYSDVDCMVLDFLEPSANGRSSVSWLLSYLRRVIHSRSSGSSGKLVVIWPVLGFLDILIIRILATKNALLVIHDPVPLVKSKGYDRISAALGKFFLGDCILAVHSSSAEAALVAAGFPTSNILVIPHPFALVPTALADKRLRIDECPAIRVLGQFKQDRDVSALKAIAKQNKGRFKLEIWGRGWDELDGWAVHNEFVSEIKLDWLISTASVVLIPYTRFFQSGIAFRCLENLTPVVGPKESSLEELLGIRSKFLVDRSDNRELGESWVSSIEHAIQEGPKVLRKTSILLEQESTEAWRSWAVF